MNRSSHHDPYFYMLFSKVVAVASCEEMPEKMLVCFSEKNRAEMLRAQKAFESKYNVQLERWDTKDLGPYCGFWMPVLVYGPRTSSTEQAVCHPVRESIFLDRQAQEGLILSIHQERDQAQLNNKLRTVLQHALRPTEENIRHNTLKKTSKPYTATEYTMKKLYEKCVLTATCKERPNQMLLCFYKTDEHKMEHAISAFKKKYNYEPDKTIIDPITNVIGYWVPKTIVTADKEGNEKSIITNDTRYLHEQIIQGTLMHIQTQTLQELQENLHKGLQRVHIAKNFSERN